MTGMLASLAGGALLGFAGSLHCACMCGGIASGALFSARGGQAAAGVRRLVLMQVGRVGSYVALGVVAASTAGFAFDAAMGETGLRVLQWASAASLMFIGLSFAGLLPALPAASGSFIPRIQIAQHVGFEAASPALLGAVWGLTPCPLVYGALFSASLSGSGTSGGLMMLGFGVGTLPGVLGAALGLSTVTSFRKDKRTRVVMGVAVACFGIFLAGLSPNVSTLFCLAR